MTHPLVSLCNYLEGIIPLFNFQLSPVDKNFGPVIDPSVIAISYFEFESDSV